MKDIDGPTQAATEALRTLLGTRFGLTFPARRRPLLLRAVEKAMSEHGSPSADEYVQLCSSEPHALARLASLATIHETYFFRHPEQLEAVRRTVLPAIVRDRSCDPERTIRAWSAGCATGEEAYTLAILLQESIALLGWSKIVSATDLDAEAIAHGARGSYRRSSFRQPGSESAPWLPQGQDGEFLVEPRLRSLVEFSVHNLAAAGAAPPVLGGPADLVFFRNVLMYLDPGASRNALALIRRTLRPGGWLVTGPTETDRRLVAEFETHIVNGITLFRRPTAAPAVKLPIRPPMQVMAVAPPKPVTGYAAPPPAPLRASVGVVDGRGRLARARRLADGGLLEEARLLCQEVLHEGTEGAAAHRVLADIAEARGDLPAAAGELRAALRDGGEDAVLRLRLALVERRRGNDAASQHALRTALLSLERLQEHEVLDDEGALSVARARGVAMSMLGGVPHG